MPEVHTILTTAPPDMDGPETVPVRTIGPTDRGKILRLVRVTEEEGAGFFARTQAQADRYVGAFHLAKIDPNEEDIAIIMELLEVPSEPE